MEKVKTCVTCRHHEGGGIRNEFGEFTKHYCGRESTKDVDIVTGATTMRGLLECRSEREFGRCGKEGRFWEAKE